mmetsp:Transcript_62216/g.166660  ORF Transcript_62216/g.166660 Transcript_62216/m.166660 type:complete len:212 (-) Transcript_62216:1033-1668(-)
MCAHFWLLQKGLSVILLQHLDCRLHALYSLLIIASRSFIIFVFFGSVLIHLLLRCGNVAQLSLKSRNVICEAGDGSISFVNFAREGVDVFLMLGLLLFGLRHLLVAESLLRGLLLSLIQQLLNHALNQPFHLGKYILASTSSSCTGRLGSQQADLHAILLPSQRAQHLHDPYDALRIVLSVGVNLQEKSIRPRISTTSLLLDNLFGSCESL